MTFYDHLIVGGGVAGTTAAETIRKRDPNATIAMVSAERHPLYSRVLLPHYVKGAVSRGKVFLRGDDHYKKLSIEFLSHRRVIGLASTRHEVSLDDGEIIRYGTLLWAAGGEARRPAFPGANLPGVLYFRTLEDADATRREVDRLASLPERERVAVVVGGGFIALEFPPFFRARGIDTHLVLDTPRYWDHLLDPESSGIIHDTFTSHGVHLSYNEACSGFLGEHALQGVQTASGRDIRARVVGMGVGLTHETAMLRTAGIETNVGVVVDEYLETNVPDVFAAGDIAEFFDVYAGRRRHVGNWMNAQEQGRVAGANMAGAHEAFRLVSQYATQIFNTMISFVGDVGHLPGVRTMFRGDRASRARAQFFIRESRLVGATLIGLPLLRGPISALIKSGAPVREADLADSGFDLGKLV